MTVRLLLKPKSLSSLVELLL